MSSSYEFVMHTWGCKVNTYDTGLLQSRLAAAASASAEVSVSVQSPVSANRTETAAQTDADAATVADAARLPRVHVLNTCAVTEEASREAAREVRRIRSREPLSKIVVTGCGAQVDGGIFDSLPGVDLVVANSHKGEIESLIDRLFKGTLESRVFRSNIFRKDDLEEGGGLEADHTRAFLKIQDGCNSFCTYCVIPFARGKSRSIPIDRLVKRVNELAAGGAKEVVLTGVHIGDYEDGENRFEDLVEAVLERATIRRVRLSSLEPVELTPRLLDLFAHPKMCRHFHMSIQSACTSTLERMRRKYGAEDVEWALNEVARRYPDAFVGMDVIVGFPGETEEEFQDTYSRLMALPWSRIHVFPYSERPGTKALKLEGSVPTAIRARRAAQLRTASSERFRQRAESVIGTLKQGLVLNTSNDAGSYVPALTADYWPVRLALNSDKVAGLNRGDEVVIELTRFVVPTNGRMDGWMEGEVRV